ncbi:MAG: DUF4350 domain-containing protein [Clostridiaceae bacterium]|nr:DUF4350 domain-containing protein [Clostridiaceae bacterium]
MQGNNPTVENNSGGGLSVFYKTLRELKLPVEKTLKPIEEASTKDIQIVVQSKNFDINSVEVEDWVNKGGILVYLSSDNLSLFKVSLTPEIKGNMKIYHMNKGIIIVEQPSYITNKTLMSNTSNAYELLNEICSKPYRNICFAEGYLFSEIEEKSLWDFIPIEGKFIIYQVVLIGIAFFYYKGKRFGKALPLYDEVERDENEYLYSTASLYRVVKCWDLIAQNYYKSLLREIRFSSENLVEYWEKENLPALSKAKKVYEFMENKNTRVKRKKYVEMISSIEQLKDILKKRRDINWKNLKKTQ